MFIRKATHEDIAAAHEIYKAAREYMKESGNPTQWQGQYPSDVDVAVGIQTGARYVAEDGGEVVAAFHFEIGHEPTYDKIFEGEWKDDGTYAFIHRIAVKYHGRGIADFCFTECFKMHPNIRIDTHRNNAPMRAALLRNGFSECGIIYLASGDERIAYQKVD